MASYLCIAETFSGIYFHEAIKIILSLIQEKKVTKLKRKTLPPSVGGEIGENFPLANMLPIPNLRGNHYIL